MPMQVRSCPKCGAMIVAQLSRCRQCKTYLHGTGVEGFLLEQFLPPQIARSPGTTTLSLAICLYYGLMLAAVQDESFFGFSGFSLQQLGATHGPSILLGQWWRFVTSIFGHHDFLHLALNLASLVAVGDIVERIFDRKKMILIYVGSGVFSMIVSHIWYVFVLDHVTVVSAGASGAVCGLIGAALFGAKKAGPEERDVAQRMKRWAILMVLWGFAVPGINNAAHFGGFLAGAALARMTPTGVTKTVAMQRALSIATFGVFLVIAGCVALMIDNLRGMERSLDRDLEPRAILGRIYYDGVEYKHSSQKHVHDNCLAAVDKHRTAPETQRLCELDMRVNDDDVESYLLLSSVLRARGDTERAEKIEAVAARLRASYAGYM